MISENIKKMINKIMDLPPKVEVETPSGKVEMDLHSFEQ